MSAVRWSDICDKHEAIDREDVERGTSRLISQVRHTGAGTERRRATNTRCHRALLG